MHEAEENNQFTYSKAVSNHHNDEQEEDEDKGEHKNGLDDDEDDRHEDNEGQAEADAEGQVGGRDGRGGLSDWFGSVDHDGVEAHYRNAKALLGDFAT